MTGALMSWGCRGQRLAELLRLARKHRLTTVFDVRPPSTHPGFGQARLRGALTKDGRTFKRGLDLSSPAFLGSLYSACRGGARVLLLDDAVDPAGTARERAMAAIAREAGLYARSAMAPIIQRIEIAHLVGNERRAVPEPGRGET